MEVQNRLTNLKKRVMTLIADAATEHNTRVISTYSPIANWIEETQHHVARIEEQINGYEKNLENLAHPLTDPKEQSMEHDEVVEISEPGQSQRKQLGDEARQQFVDLCPIPLRRVSGKLYETNNGEKVGIPFANELERRPDRWWLGIKDDRYDVVILLCRPQNSEVMLDFVLPPDFLKRVWHGLSPSAGEVKFNIVREGNNYSLLVRPRRRESINQFLGNYRPLEH
jgi:hypothetical protein